MLGTVSVSSLKFASMTYAVLADCVTVASLRCVGCEDWRVLGFTLERVRAGKIPSIGIWAGSIYTKGGRSWSSVSSLAIVTCLHRGAKTMFSCAFTSHVLLCEVGSSVWGLARARSSFLPSVRPLG